MNCQPHDLVFGASNVSIHSSTVLHVRGLDPGDAADRRELAELACDPEVREVLERRQLKFAAPKAFQLSRGRERVSLAGTREGKPPFAVLGSVPRNVVTELLGKAAHREPKELCDAEAADGFIQPMPERIGFTAPAPWLMFRIDLLEGDAQQMVLRFVPADDAPSGDCFVARIDHYAELEGKRRLSREVLLSAKRRDAVRELGVHYLGGMTALFVQPYDPF